MKYTVKWTRDDRDRSVTRNAATACEACEAVCDQFGWGYRLKTVDPETRGDLSAAYSADPTGSCICANPTFTVFASIAEEGF